MGKHLALCAVLFAAAANAAPKIRTLIVDGQNNHEWKSTTPVLKRLLEETGRFEVEVATTPPQGADLGSFQPNFAAYRLVVSNYNGDPWSDVAQKAFEKYMRAGGGLVVYHAADNAFPQWTSWNEMIALGGWGGRTETAGSLVRFRDGKVILESKPGRAGNHGRRLPFALTMRDMRHPISAGLPDKWMHAADELYDSMRGPAKNFVLLGTGWSDPANRGTGENEPLLLTVSWGKGRVFHTMLGHDTEAMRCVGFINTLQRGAEWAATGKVTVPVPKDFPTADQVRVR